MRIDGGTPIPGRSPIFPLPNTILFPNTILPLVIYEPQYRLMLEHCLKGDGMMGVVLLKKGNPKSLLDAPTYSVAGLGRITRVMRLPDSSFSVFLGGIARVAIRRYTQHNPYLVAEIERLECPPFDPVKVNACRLRTLELFGTLTRMTGPGYGELVAHLEKLGDADITSNLIAAAINVDPHIKQKILETLDLRERLEELVLVLERQIRHEEIMRRILSRAPKNIDSN